MAERTPDNDLTPGALLRRSRLRYGWSLEDVADELKLLPYVVEAIEQDDYSKMAGWTYVVGYLRSYAKLVGVNIELAISAHSSLFPQKEDGPGTLTHRTVAKVPIAISFSWIVTVVVVVVVIGGLGTTYWKRGSESDRVSLENKIPENQQIALSVNSEPISERSSGLGESSNDSERNNIEEKIDTAQNLPTKLQLNHLDLPIENTPPAVTGEMPIDLIEVEILFETLTLANIDTRIIGSFVRLVTDAQLNQDKNIMTVNSVLPSDLKPDIFNDDNRYFVELFFDEGSWADVRDSSDQQLLRESVPAGGSIRLKGNPPFTIFVGNAAGVRYLYLGEEKKAPASGESLFGRFQLGASD